MNSLLAVGISLMERGWLPDAMTRSAIRRLCRQRLRQGSSMRDPEFTASLRSGPIALVPEKANEQHYEVPPEFYQRILGPRLKYSCCFFAHPETDLAKAEIASLDATCDRADLADGQDILELGCGWGSLSIWMAQRYPASRIVAVSNSVPQRRYIEQVADELDLKNLRVITADMNAFSPEQSFGANGQFDRIVSVEMFEHMRNYELLLARIARWLRSEGKLFVHLFCHREIVYPFEIDGNANWLGRYFFSGGIMPSANLLREFNHDLHVVKQWTWDGTHYQRTCRAWLSNLDRHRADILRIFKSTYGHDVAKRWLHRWRAFLHSGAELFGFNQGRDWFVAHYLLQPIQSR